MGDKPQARDMSDDEIANMPDEGRALMSRIQAGARVSDQENQYLADQIKQRDAGQRAMFDSDPLQKAMRKLSTKR